ncbi:MAG: DUF4031 domain-containing protein [Anaerolineaceae bacterium]|nr:DUF4031 domain-containing protein [Anaerolineaceae bacterium]
MTIYVDELRDYRALLGIGFPGLWCHLVTDGELEELHQFAGRLGIQRKRFQNHPRHPHYDLHPPGRELAVVLGAVEVTTAQLARLFHQRPQV